MKFLNMERRRRQVRLSLSAAAALVLSGCTTFSPDGGMTMTSSIAQNELGAQALAIRSDNDAAFASQRVGELLAKPLTAENAVQVALYNNRSLQAAYNALGVSEAEFVQASLPTNPTISIGRMSGDGITEVEGLVMSSLLDLVTLPKRKRIAEARFRQAQYRAAEETLATGAEARRSFYEAVAAHQRVHFLQRARLSANAASEIAQELGKTGGLPKIDQAREHAFYAEVTAQLGRARQEEKAARERLVRALGLWGPALDFQLPGSLPGLPKALTLTAVERQAIQRRLDLQIARLELETMARSLNLEDMTQFVDVLDLAGTGMWEREKAEGETEKTELKGLEVELVVPIFDLGRTKIRRAEQQYLQAVNNLASQAVDVRSQAREAYQTYRGAHDLARHYRNEIVPLRKQITDESLLLYNTMNIDVLDLLADSRAQIESNIAAIEAQRDFWLADTNLKVALTSGSPAGGSGGEGGTPVAAVSGGGGH